jgi:integrase
MNLSMARRIYPQLWQHPNHTWYVLYGRKTRKSLKTRDRAEARELFQELRTAYRQQRLTLLQTGCRPIRLVDFWEEYEEYRFKTARPFTCQADRQAFRVFRQALGDDTHLHKITRQRLEKALAALGQQVSPVSANTWFRHFKAALSKAVAWGYLAANPCQGIKLLKTQGDFPRFITEAEFSRLLEAEPDPLYRLFWRFQVYGGARRSESLGLSAQDIDWPLNRINLGRTKNGKPKFIVITPKIREILQELNREVGRLWPWQPDSVSHHFQRTARAAGLACRLHDLRHTYGSWLVMRGVPLRTVQLLMGHQDSKTTERYAHLSQDYLEEAAGRL